MSQRPKTVCRQAGCPVLLEVSGYCEKHQAMKRKVFDDRRGTAAQRGYNSRWQKASKTYLRDHPLCAEHAKLGEDVIAVLVDHIIPHKGDQTLFWDTSNWQSLCKCCHDTKTATEDGGFGRRPGGGRIFGRFST